MLTSENESHTMWCPFVRVDGGNRINNSLTDGFENSPAPFHCIGKRCMAWRELHSSHIKAGAEKALQGHGYCGLSGRPDMS